MNESSISNYDVVICGAGPSGTTCALALSNKGLKVAVIEKHKFPRDKICGDAVAAYVPKVLNTINPEFVKELNKFNQNYVVNTCRIIAPNEKFIDVTFSESGFISMRMNWDNFLYELAAKQPGITFYLEHEVDGVVIKEDGVTVTTKNKKTFNCKIIVGCDGAHSVVAKHLTDTKKDLRHHSGAVRAYFKNVKDIPDKTFELHFIKDVLPGYFWIFPLQDGYANVGLGALSSVISERKMNLRNTMNDIIANNPYLKKRFEGAEMIGTIRGYDLPLGSRKVTMSGSRFMLCGDAASQINPVTGEGIGQAMVNGRYAGWHAAKCFEQHNFTADFMKQYDEQVHAKFWNENKRYFFIQKLIDERQWMINLGITLAKNNKFIYAMMKKFIW